MHCRPTVLGLNITLNQICYPLRNYIKAISIVHCFWACSEKSAKSETSNYGIWIMFFTFFWNAASKKT